MTVAEFLSHLESLDVKVWAEGDQLRCNAPRGVLTPELQNELKNRKTEILTLLSLVNGSGSSKEPPIKSAVRDGRLPLSFPQQRLWFLHQLEPESPAYNTSLALRFHGLLDVTALEQSLQALVDRHEILRTCFLEVNDQPYQVIADALTIPFTQRDLRALPEADREAAAQELIRQQAMQPFNLATGPVIRTCLLQIAEEDFVLMITLHHIISDGWSMGVVSREVAALYDALVHHQPSPLLPLPIQYADFADWQREWLTGEVLDQQLRYWQEHLADLAPLELPTDRPRPPVQTYNGAKHLLELPHSLRDQLQTLSRQEGVSLAIMLLAAFQVLLARYTGQTDIVVGSPIANRNRREIEGLIGFFVNSLVMRTDLSGDPEFREALRRVREVALGAYDHQDLPFERLVEELQPDRDPSRNPLFQVMFAVQNAPFEGFTLPGVRVQSFDWGTTTVRVDLECHIRERHESLQMVLIYNTDLFEAKTLERFSHHFQRTLEEVVRDPSQRLSQLPLLSGHERQQVLVEWNDTTTTYPNEASIQELFEAQVAQTPEAVALVCEDQQLTYAELNTRANQLAHTLRQHGVGPEGCVGLCLERSVEMVVGVLGILKAGGAYVPLDPSAPPSRLSLLLQDADIAILLTQAHLRATLPEFSGTILSLDPDWATITQAPTSNLPSTVTADHLAYVIYTSGSTGMPKGTSIAHRNVVRLVKHTNYLDFGPEETFLQLAPLAFDASTLELWGSLLHGAKLVIVSPHQPSLEELGHVIQEKQITTLWLTAALFHQMVDSQLDALRGVRQVLAGGDVLSIPHVQRLLPTLKGRRLINGYGPTENTTFTCCHIMTADSQVERSVPIGRPIANTQVYVLDRQRNPVPVGVFGELYIGGDGLARNYLYRPDLTAEKFVPHLFSDEPGPRLYKTGDMVRYRPDGALEFKGRVDHQIKLRGYRIELGEIEGVLSQHPGVDETVVMMREDEPDKKRLVAYVVSAPHSSLSVESLRSFLKARLPDYMVPAAFMVLDALPLSPNGKLDRHALPIPDLDRFSLASQFTAPRTVEEELIAGIWSEVLGLSQVSVDDNFFDVGGHSLLATKIISRLHATFHIEFPLRFLLEAPTVAGLAVRLQQLRRSEGSKELTPIPCFPRDGALPLSFAQERFWLLNEFHTDKAAYNVPTAFRLQGLLQFRALKESFQALVDRHEILRTTFSSIDGQPRQVIAPNLSLEVQIQDLSAMEVEEQTMMINQVFAEEWGLPFDLEQGPLIRMRLYRFEETDHFLMLNVHHIIHDAWSMEVMIQELVAEYTARCEGHPAVLPSLPIQYADYAQWQRERMAGPVGQRQLAFWKEQLANLPPPLPLPTDYPRPVFQSLRGTGVSQQVSPEVTDRLRDLNRQEGTTIFMVLLAAFQLFLHRYTGEQNILVGAPQAGRDRPEVQNLLGCFLNSLVLRTEFSKLSSGRALIQRVREVCLNAYAHQEVPFEKLLADLDPPRYLNRTPVFQVALNMHTFADQDLPLTGLQVIRQQTAQVPSMFDLTLYFHEFPDHINLYLVYKADLFSPMRMQEMLQQIQHVLEQLVSVPDQALATYSLVTPNSKGLLPDPSVPIAMPRQTRVPEMVAHWVGTTPNHPAIKQGAQQWSYGELVAQAEGLGQALVAEGLRAGTVVAISGPSSFGLIVSLLGVLRCGGVLLTLDPSLPDARKSTLLHEAKAHVLLFVGEEDTEASWANTDDIRRWRVSPNTGQILQSASLLLLAKESIRTLLSGDPAYIFFTSGTTGTPKGIVGSHQSLSHFLTWQREQFGLSPSDRVAQLTGLSFDVVLRDIFLPLISGSVLCLPEDTDRLDGEQLLRWLDREHITVLHTVPALATSWLADGPNNVTFNVTLSTMRWVFFAGEPLTNQLVHDWRSAFPKSGQLVNLYGPTETTLAKCFYQIPDDPLDGVQPIGQPLPHTQVLVMNEGHSLCGIGERGEIVIRTPFRSLGPLPSQAEAPLFFQPNPYHPDIQEDLYYTGDLGRYRPDGTVEILGRLDDQVKIRGMRVEPNEVMHVLAAHPDVASCFVLGRKEEDSESELAAYVVPMQGKFGQLEPLREYLEARLPGPLVPTAWVFLDILPLTSNGKVDRHALPVPERGRVQLEAPYVAPRSPLEEAVAEILREVLCLEQVGSHDNFFELGGHSLLAIRAISRIRNTFEVNLKLRDFFAMPTVAGIAEGIEAVQWNVQKTSRAGAPSSGNRKRGRL